MTYVNATSLNYVNGILWVLENYVDCHTYDLFKLYAIYMPILCILIKNAMFLLVKWNIYIVYLKAMYFNQVDVMEMK